MKVELRCQYKMHGVLYPAEKAFEVKCFSRFCGHQPGVVVIHRFSIETGELLNTYKFRDPGRRKQNGTHHNAPSVRTA